MLSLHLVVHVIPYPAVCTVELSWYDCFFAPWHLVTVKLLFPHCCRKWESYGSVIPPRVADQEAGVLSSCYGELGQVSVPALTIPIAPCPCHPQGVKIKSHWWFSVSSVGSTWNLHCRHVVPFLLLTESQVDSASPASYSSGWVVNWTWVIGALSFHTTGGG